MDASTLLTEKEHVFFPSHLTYAIRTLCFQSVKASDYCSGEKISLDGHS